VIASVMEYLTDRVYGRPLQGNPEQPVTIQLHWASMPEWLQSSVMVNQQVNNIITSTDRAEEIGNSSTGKHVA
jgi:hypothetical protein